MKTYTFVLVHGAWHTGEHMQGVANALREKGHTVHTPTLVGSATDDDKSATLEHAIDGLVQYYSDNKITDAIMYSHSYGGMVATGAYDRFPEGTVRRLIYHCAFVPNSGESLQDLCPVSFREAWKAMRKDDDSCALPYMVWRDALMNDADEDLAKSTFESLVPHPYYTSADKISLSRDPVEFTCGKSYIKSQWDWGQPPSLLGYYRFVERLGLYRHVEMVGGHETCFTDPIGLAEHIIIAGRD